MSLICKMCGEKMESVSIGWICSKCKVFEDMRGITHPHVETPFMPPQTNADYIRSSIGDDDCLTELIWHDCWDEIFNIPEFDSKQELVDWLRQPKEE